MTVQTGFLPTLFTRKWGFLFPQNKGNELSVPNPCLPLNIYQNSECLISTCLTLGYLPTIGQTGDPLVCDTSRSVDISSY